MSTPRSPHEADTNSTATPYRSALRDVLEEQTILEHLPLADSIARRFGRGGPDVEDMIQVARMALVKAARRFDPERNPSFVAYARPTIAGELKRYLRDNAWMVQPPRSIQDLHAEIAREHPGLCQMLGREPTLAELAGHLGEEPGVVAEAITSHNSLQPDSLDMVCGGRPLEDHVPDHHAEVFGALDDSLALAEALRTLTHEEKELLQLRFYAEQSQQRIGEQLDMTQVQVSRALSRILVRLQRHMLNRHPDEGGAGRAVTARAA